MDSDDTPTLPIRILTPEHHTMSDPAQRPPSLSDLNGNGIPDWREGWFWATVWNVFSFGVRTFAGQNTVIRRGVDAAEAERSKLLGSIP